MHTATVHTQMYTSAKFEISNTTKSTKNIYIVGREEQNLSRLITESMYIRVNCSEISLPYAYILDNFNSDFNFDFNSNSECSHI